MPNFASFDSFSTALNPASTYFIGFANNTNVQSGSDPLLKEIKINIETLKRNVSVDTTVRSLTGNWQSTFTSVAANSAIWNVPPQSVTLGALSGYSSLNIASANTPTTGARVVVVGSPVSLISGTQVSFFGGYGNRAQAKYSQIIGGVNNDHWGDYSSIIGGYNSVLGIATVYCNIIDSANAFISYSDFCSIFNSMTSRLVSSRWSSINGGYGQFMIEGTHCDIINGLGNLIGYSAFSALINGQHNEDMSGSYNTVINGLSNFQSDSSYTTIINGIRNRTVWSKRSGIIGGRLNKTEYTDSSFIIGGFNNRITGTSTTFLSSTYVLGANLSATNSNTVYTNNIHNQRTINTQTLTANAIILAAPNGTRYQVTVSNTGTLSSALL